MPIKEKRKKESLTINRKTIRKRNFPYITKNPKIAGGTPLIEGTRITVRVIAGYYQLGMNVDEILSALKHLTPAQVHSALAYYFENQVEIDEALKLHSDVKYWQKMVQVS